MKYEIHLTKSEAKTIEVFAENPRAALKLAREAYPDFNAHNATELIGEDEVGESFEVIGGCESCEQLIFDGEPSIVDEEGIRFCSGCTPAAEMCQPEGETP